MGDKIMVETGCEPYGRCNNDQRSFKAYLSQWLARTAQLVPARYETIMPYLRSSVADAAGQLGDNGKNCGREWNTTTWDGTEGVGESMSALAVVQAMMLDVENLKAPFTTNTGGTSKSNPNAGTDGNGVDPASNEQRNKAATRPITTGDRAGAAVVTVVLCMFMFGGTVWLIAS